MAKFIIGVIVGIFLGAATSAYSGVAVGRVQESAAFLSGPLEMHLLQHPALAVSRITALAVSRH
jgi:hypothetical protein